MKGFYCILLSFFLLQSVAAQTIKGVVKEASGDAVAGATITVQNTFSTTTTDKAGFFRLSTGRTGEHRLLVSSVGYEPAEQTVLLADTTAVEVEITLNRSISSLKEVTITASRRPKWSTAHPPPCR